jgi:two-component system response regulator HupR/HoxA
VLQEGEIRPLGAQRPRKVDVRVVSATNRDLTEEVAAGRFRRDLYYRVATFPIHMPALADRAQDIPAIAARMLLQVNQAFGRQIPGFAPQAIEKMMAYRWPGNVRELHNEIQRMVVLAPTDEPLPASLLSIAENSHAPAVARRGNSDTRPLRDQVADLERDAIEAALKRHRDNISRAADELGLSRVGLRSKIERYHLRRDVHGFED